MSTQTLLNVFIVNIMFVNWRFNSFLFACFLVIYETVNGLHY